jgi:hypothetical protein
MQTGSPRHKRQFLENLKNTYQENIWKDEINALEFEELLGHFRTELADIDLKLERKEFKSANEGRKQMERKQSEIEAATAGLAAVREKIVRWNKQIELINRYQEAA